VGLHDDLLGRRCARTRAPLELAALDKGIDELHDRMTLASGGKLRI
jgi:hypothetical protein